MKSSIFSKHFLFILFILSEKKNILERPLVYLGSFHHEFSLIKNRTKKETIWKNEVKRTFFENETEDLSSIQWNGQRRGLNAF